jgi:hypothetical protein
VKLDVRGAKLVKAPPWEDMAGSRVVVCGGGSDVEEVARQAALRAPGCVLLVAPDDVDRALAASLLPRGRVLGTDDPGPLAEAVLVDADVAVSVRVGGAAAPRTVRLGALGAR